MVDPIRLRTVTIWKSAELTWLQADQIKKYKMRYAIALIFLSHFCFSQNILIKENGEQIQFKKIKFYSTVVEIVTNNKDKIDIDVTDITAFYDGKDETMYYSKRGLPDPETSVRSNYEFLEMITEGKISLYKKVVRISSYNNKGGPSDYYYAEKGMQFKNVFRAEVFRKNKDELKVLKSLLEDDPELLKKLDDENFKFDEKKLISLIKEYNVRNMVKADTGRDQTHSEFNFHIQEEASMKQAVSIIFNDTLVHKLNPGHPVPVKLSKTFPSKVCLILETESVCEVLNPMSIPGMYYEIVYTNGFNGFVGYKAFEIKRKF